MNAGTGTRARAISSGPERRARGRHRRPPPACACYRRRADGADAVLRLEQPAVLLAAEAIIPVEPRGAVARAQGGVRAPLVAPLRVEPIAVRRAIGAVGGELLLAMLSILGISPPVLLVAESHGRFRQHARLVRPAPHAGTTKPPGARGECRASGAGRRTNVLWRRVAPSARRKPARTITTRRTPAGAWHHRSDQTQV